MTAEELRKQFPILERSVYGKRLVYLDNAATSQRPVSVMDKMSVMMGVSNANIHRAVHRLSAEATEEYESTRDFVQRYINAESREEIIFTSGATASLNLVAFCIGEKFINVGDEIIVSEAEHHSNIVPWQMMAQRKGATIKVLPVDDSGHLMVEKLDDLIVEGKTKILSVAHISNVLGLVNPLEEIVEICHRKNCLVCVDGAQGIVHQKVDVQKIKCDFYAFSGHKVYASTGTGVLYIAKPLCDELPPYMGGGEMIQSVKFSGTTYTDSPGKFEAGTQNFCAVPTLKPALELAESLFRAEIEQSQQEIRQYLLSSLGEFPGLVMYGVPEDASEKVNLFSFGIEGVHHEDIALILDKMGIAVRSGQMCAEPLMDRFGVTGMVRASFAPYNTMQEAQQFTESLYRAVKMLR